MIHYISPSVIPSRSANSVHVLMQVRALADVRPDVTLYACHVAGDQSTLAQSIEATYGISMRGIRLKTLSAGSGRGVSARIALRAVPSVARTDTPALVISRNLYASFALGAALRRPIVFETHQLERGARGVLQKRLIASSWVTTVAISRSLVDLLQRHHGVRVARPVVLRDAAPAGRRPVEPCARRPELMRAFPDLAGEWRIICGYFGQLYEGRGVDVIRDLAGQRPQDLFVVAGGSDGDINACRSKSRLANLKFLGHLPHARALRMMQCVDILLMPYQQQVSIGVSGHDTARWMSPMKMFEYMASGVPIISSRLPALAEVLRDGENALLVEPDDRRQWLEAVDGLAAAPELRERLASTAFREYETEYTWEKRALRLLSAAPGVC